MKKNIMKKVWLPVFLTVITVISGCGSTSDQISVVSREEGSGTRSAFVELMEILLDDQDLTTENAEITNSTSVMLSTIEGNKNAIGYVSLGTLNDNVKALQIDGIEPNQENVKNGTYAVSRPFNIVTKENLSEQAEDFIQFILSDEGQKIVEEEGYISINGSGEYKAIETEGKITIAGSTSVAPLMEVLAEQYKGENPNVSIEIQQSGSSAGILSTVENACEIGMVSRDLKESEIEENLITTTLALDGIAVIVNNENTVDTLSSDMVKKVFTGEVAEWNEVK